MWKLSLIAASIVLDITTFFLNDVLPSSEHSVVHLTQHHSLLCNIWMSAEETGLLLSDEVKAHSHHLIILLTRFNPQGMPQSRVQGEEDVVERKLFPASCFTTKNRFQHVTIVIAHHRLTAVNNLVTCCSTFSLILQSNNVSKLMFKLLGSFNVHVFVTIFFAI